jgi:hypothetical protein
MTLPTAGIVQPLDPSSPETFELSLKTPAKSIRELSRRVLGGTSSASAASSPDRALSDEEDNIRNEVDPPADAQPVVQRWNEPKGNIPRLGFAFFSFIVTGLNDGAVGVWTCSLCSHQLQHANQILYRH